MQAEHAQAGLSGQLRQAQRQLQEAEGKLQASQDSLAFVAAEKKALSRQCSEMEQRLNRMQQVSWLPVLLMFKLAADVAVQGSSIPSEPC